MGSKGVGVGGGQEWNIRNAVLFEQIMGMEVTLVKLSDRHEEGLTKAANHPSLARSLRVGFPSPYTLSHARWFINFASNNDKNVEINRCIIYNGEVVGVISTWRARTKDKSTWEIGYWVSPDFQRRGIGSKAIGLMVEGIGGGLEGRIGAVVRVGNVGSMRVLEANGFKREGVARGLENGIDSVVYGLVKKGSGGRAGRTRGNFVHYEDGGLVCSEDHVCEWKDGRITSFGPAGEGCDLPVPVTNTFFLPGFIDLHNHAPQHAFVGLGLDKPLMGEGGWLETYTFKAEKRCCDDYKVR